MAHYDVCFVLIYDDKVNKYTANVLIAAIESYARYTKLFLMPLDKIANYVQELTLLNEKCRKLIVGLTFMTTQIDEIRNIVPNLRKTIPKALFIAGGAHASGDPYGTLTRLGFDIIVYGEGEATVVDILNSVYNDEDINVCGTAYIEGGKLIIKRRHPVDLDLYPPFPYWRNMFNPIEIMRGCSSACLFCQVSYVFGAPRYRSVDVILHYSKIKLEKGLKDLRFIAPNSFGYGSPDGIKPNASMLIGLLQKLRELTKLYNGRLFFGTFPSEVRPDSVEEELVKNVRRLVDNKRIIIGIQSGSPKTLARVCRGHDLETALHATKILIENGFQVEADFIIGFGFETDEDIENTLNFIEKLAALGVRIHLHTYIPLPGTPLFSVGFRPLNPVIKRRLSKLVGEGKAYGYWIRQEALAEKIDMLKKIGVILDWYSYKNSVKIVYC